MRFKTRVMLAIGCVSLLALSSPAFSLPSPQANAHKQRAVQKKNAAQHAPNRQANTRAARANPATRLASLPIAEPPKRPMFGWPTLVSEARKYMGTNPTARSKLWCATFMNLVLAKVGYAGTNSDAAKSFAQYGRRISEPRIGAIAVLTRGKKGGHVGVVTGIDQQGNPIIISGNHNKRVGEATYSRSCVIAYVMPTGSGPMTTEVAARSQPSNASQPSRTSSEPGIASPIAELLAAIEAEQSRPERPSQQAQARPVEPRLVVQQQPAEPHRAVQQAPEQVPQSTQASRRELAIDPALAEFLGIANRAQIRSQDRGLAAPAARPASQRQRQVQQNLHGRVANADTVIAGVFGLR
ncbi:MAG: TIGR02594 family protein [Pseudolabrys sp.]|nr:TIGR02594 family protein [Pseudolabrys sp.]